MRGVLVRNVGVGILALALTVLTGCNDDPLSFDVKDTAGIVVTPTYMVLASGRTAEINSRTVNQGQEPTYEKIDAGIDPTCGSATLTVVPNTKVGDAQPPGRFDVTGGSTLGTTCITLTGGGATASVEVVVIANEIAITNNPVTVRAGDSGTLTAQLLDVAGNEVEPYDVAATEWTSDNADAVDVSAGGGAWTASEAGTAVVTVEWLGQAENGTADLGVTITADATITVIAAPPSDAYFTVTGDTTTNLGSSAVDETIIFDVSVVDADGNRNTFPDEILGVTIDSADPLVATATAAIFTDDPAFGQGSVPVVTVVTVGAGTATLTGVVETTSGDLPFEGELTVLAPAITSLSATSGGFAETVTITGTGLSAAGFVTLVYADGEQLGNFTVVSDTEITAQMPTYAAPGTHDITVEVGGVLSSSVTWEQTNSCVAQDFPEEPGFSGPFVPVSIPLECNGTLAGPQDDWFFTDISTDALGGAEEISVTLAPTWEAIKDIDWYYCTASFSCFFEIDELPATATLDLEAGTHIWVADDFAGFGGDNTPQPYTVIVTID